MDLQTPEEFKREVFREVDKLRTNFNGFMVTEIDKNLTQAYCSTRKNDSRHIVFRNRLKSASKRSQRDSTNASSKSIGKDLKTEEDGVAEELAFKRMITAHYCSKIKECNDHYDTLAAKLGTQRHQDRRSVILRLEDFAAKANKKQSTKQVSSLKSKKSASKLFQNTDFYTLRADPNVRKLIESSKRLLLPSLSKRMNRLKNYR